MNWTKDKMLERLIRYEDLIPCKNAFVDTRTPGSDRKENFTLIGPGVAENPNQYVHIKERHGFNIGGARQPAKCLNSQHSHISAEVFMAHSGKWRMIFGVNADEGSVELNAGDTISIPTDMFRGFENIGDDVGFLYAVLGRDNPGKVTWSPEVFDLAKEYGLVLLKGGKLVDTTIGETIPEDGVLEEPPSEDEIKNRLATPPADKLAQCVIKYNDLQPNPKSPLASEGIRESGVITPAQSNDGFSDEGINPWWEHDFHFRKLSIDTNKKTKFHQREEEEVIFVQEGSLEFCWREGDNEEHFSVNKGDTLTVPKGVIRAFENKSDGTLEAFVVRGGLSPNAPIFA